MGCGSWSLENPKIELMFRPPVDLYVDEWVYEVLDAIERTGATRLAIDSLGDLRVACGDELRFREYMYSLLQRCARKNVSVIMTQEASELFGLTRLSEFGSLTSRTMSCCSNFSRRIRSEARHHRLKDPRQRSRPADSSSRSPLRNSHSATGSYLTRACCSHCQCAIA